MQAPRREPWPYVKRAHTITAIRFQQRCQARGAKKLAETAGVTTDLIFIVSRLPSLRMCLTLLVLGAGLGTGHWALSTEHWAAVVVCA